MKIESNIKSVAYWRQNNFKNLSKKVYEGYVGTTVEYAPPVEYGSTRKIPLGSLTPKQIAAIKKRRAEKPSKGIAKVTRTESEVVITTPPRAMVRNSIPNVQAYVANQIKSLPPIPTDQDMEQLIADAIQYAKAEIVTRTPVDTGRLKGSWTTNGDL